MKYPFLNTQQGGIQNSRRSSRLIRHACRLLEKWMSTFSYVYRSRKHWTCKYKVMICTFAENRITYLQKAPKDGAKGTLYMI